MKIPVLKQRTKTGDPAVPIAPSKLMFSAATFFDVIDSARSAVGGVGSQSGLKVPVVAFYGFRGGAGRTMSLAHVAIMLAQRGLRIAVVDADIEAPGLHVALGEKPPADDVGLVNLLRKALVTEDDQPLGVEMHLQAVSPKEGSGKVLLLPAGRINAFYLAKIEELGVRLWHEPSKSPFERILSEIEREEIHAIFVDCRTGFSGMSASILFHLSNLAVVFFPLSDQVWDGIDVLLDAERASRLHRGSNPAIIFVPSMVPPGETGKEKASEYIRTLALRYANNRDNDKESDDDLGAEVEQPWLKDGIVWDPRISAEGMVREPFLPGGAWGIFQNLCDRITTALALEAQLTPIDSRNAKGVLDEIKITEGKGFAEELDSDELASLVVPSESVRAAVDRASTLVVGAKGSGKTLLWRLLVEQNELVKLPADTVCVVGHAPRPDLDPQRLTVSADSFKELEREANMKEESTHKAFWILNTVFRISKMNSDAGDWLQANVSKPMRREWRKLYVSNGAPDFSGLLNLPRISSFAEQILHALDGWLSAKPKHYMIVFDGLDTGFQSGPEKAWYDRRQLFVTGLLQVISEWRNRLRRIQFKVFLREDIYLSIEIQNRSHLGAAKHELRFGSSDLWQLALKVATSSQTYKKTIGHARMGADGLYIGDETELKALLYPLWGRTVGSEKKAYTANYILKRTSDAQGRLFPRTFIQMLDAAIRSEKQLSGRGETDRVLRFRALQTGVKDASEKRVEDLRTEYVELKPYLDALEGAPAVATPKKFILEMKRNIGESALKLHFGTGGWTKVLDRLMTVGVMGRKDNDEEPDSKLSVALLYRNGLRVVGGGLH